MRLSKEFKGFAALSCMGVILMKVLILNGFLSSVMSPMLDSLIVRSPLTAILSAQALEVNGYPLWDLVIILWR